MLNRPSGSNTEVNCYKELPLSGYLSKRTEVSEAGRPELPFFFLLSLCWQVLEEARNKRNCEPSERNSACLDEFLPSYTKV